MPGQFISQVTPDRDSTPSVAGPVPTSAADANSKPLQSGDLFNGEKVVQIAHNGEIYRLQTTKLGKLILTK
jgi:hemin uptake protein HemP